MPIRYNKEDGARTTARTVLKAECPNASEVVVSFPDKWEWIDAVREKHGSLSIAAFPIERSFPQRHQYEGLPPEINVDLVFYRLYKCFQSWPLPQVVVESTRSRGEGFVVGDRGFKLQLQPVG